MILDSVADGIYGVDKNGNSTFVNKAMEKITGWSAPSMIGKNQHAILHHTRANGEEHPVEECPVYKTFRDENPRFVEDDDCRCGTGNNSQSDFLHALDRRLVRPPEARRSIKLL